VSGENVSQIKARGKNLHTKTLDKTTHFVTLWVQANHA